MNKNGFTLIELVVVIFIIIVLSAVLLFSVSQYVSRGKDSNAYSNLIILAPAGEVFYNVASSYAGFCDPAQNNVVKNALAQMPVNPNVASADSGCSGGNPNDNSSWTTSNSPGNPKGLCCFVANDGQSWASCVQEFTNSNNYYCVDSRGMKEEVTGTCGIGELFTPSGASAQCP